MGPVSLCFILQDSAIEIITTFVHSPLVSTILINYLPSFQNQDILIAPIQSCKNMNLVVKRSNDNSFVIVGL